MAQHFVDLYLWEVLLNEHPECGAIIELGSWKGGFSLFLEAQSKARGLLFRCYDTVVPDVHITGFKKADIFRDRDEIVAWMSRRPKPLVLFCDNGNKPRELREFTTKLPLGSIVVVHDWGTETLPEDVPDWLEEHMVELCEELESVTRIFTIKTAEDPVPALVGPDDRTAAFERRYRDYRSSEEAEETSNELVGVS